MIRYRGPALFTHAQKDIFMSLVRVVVGFFFFKQIIQANKDSIENRKHIKFSAPGFSHSQ